MKPEHLDALAGELRDHIERQTRENIERGMPADEARRAARLAFGNLAITQEDVRAVWFPPWLEHIMQDLRYALRSVTRNPLFTLIVVVTLAISIGLSTAVLGPFYFVLMRPLDYPHAERLVAVRISNPDLPADQDIATNQEYWALSGHTESLDKLMAYTSYDQTMAAGSSVSRVRVASVSDDFWSITNVQPIAGRLPQAGERNVAVLSDRLYTTAFGADPRALGQTLLLDRVPVAIVGVIARTFRFQFPVPERPGVWPQDIELYRSLAVAPPNRNFAQLISLVGRLKPNIDMAAAAAELTTVRVTRPFSRNDALTSIRIEPAAERLVKRARLPLNVLLTAVVFVLLIGCANIANLLLARATVRQREIAIRVSVGAGRARVLRQFLFESAMYSVAGGAAGLLLARWSLATLIGIFPQALPRLNEARIDGSVVAVMAAILLLVTVVFGLVPALAVARSRAQGGLKEGAPTVTAPPRRLKVRSLLAAAQLALAVALVSGAGLLVKSFWRMSDRPPGFDPGHILSMRVDFPPQTTNRARRDYATQLLARVRSLPSVESVSLNTRSDSLTRVDIVGEPESDPGSTPPIYENQTSAEFARVMGLQVLRGRWLTDDEPRPVVVVNETLAKLKFGQQDPIGQRVQGPDFGEPSDTIGRTPDWQSEIATVVGVVADLRYAKLDEERTPEVYVPYYRTPGMFRVTLVIKTAGDPMAIVPSLRTAVSELGNSEVPFDIMTLDRALRNSIAPRRLNLMVLVIFAATAVLLALVGIYGVMSYSVSQRTHELGIRTALGAPRRGVIGMVIWQGVRVAGVGIAIGVAGALAVTRLMTSLLFQVKPTDPATFATAVGVLALIAVLASAIPAIRAGAVDPIVALRYE